MTFSIISLSTTVNIAFFKVFRLFRVLKPIRIISRSENLMIAISSLISSVPSVINTQIICFLFFLIFGIIGTNLFKGAYYECNNTLL